VGSTLLGGLDGLDFILTALFIVLTIDAYRASPDNLTLGLAGGAGMVAFAVAPGSMLLIAMMIFTAVLIARYFLTRRTNRYE
jgi:predicted branched-subunit amino acid permease